MNLRDRVKQICISQNWTMKDLAKRLNISENYLHKLLSGKRGSVKRLNEIERVTSQDLPTLPSLSVLLKEKCYVNGISLSIFADRNNITLHYLYDILSGRREGKNIKKKIYEYIEGGSEANRPTNI